MVPWHVLSVILKKQKQNIYCCVYVGYLIYYFIYIYTYIYVCVHIYIYIYMYIYVLLQVYEHATVCKWTSQNNLWEPVLFTWVPGF
jgi:hypothetical protein